MSNNQPPDNPLSNLIKTENEFVQDMALIVRKVASAWSRSNFPPPDIDRMFRIIESVYRINRSFLNNLQSTNNNFKLIGDSLLNFIKNFHQPYSKYVQLYTQSPPFSSHQSIVDNSKLDEILRSIDKDIDELFNLPARRLKYYLNLYTKLLSSTNSSKPDYNLLKSSVESLQSLVDQLDNSTINILTSGPNQDNQQVEQDFDQEEVEQEKVEREEVEQEEVEQEDKQHNYPLQHQPTIRFNEPDDALKLRAAAANNVHSDSSSISTDSGDDDESSASSHSIQRSDSDNDNDTASESNDKDNQQSNDRQSTHSQSSQSSITSQQTNHIRAVNLTSRLDTSRTLDIFTMQQKKCKLQIQPSFLPFKRELIKSADVVLSFTPSAAPQSSEEIIMRRAHIFLLSDLFLVAERMTLNEKESGIAASDTDMWLSFPPLSGKFLKAFKNKQDNAFDLSIMKKETLTIKVESEIARDEWIEDIGICTNFAFNGPLNKPNNRESDESSQITQPHTSPPNNSPPSFPNPPPRDHLPTFDNIPMMGMGQLSSNGAPTPPPHSIDHQLSQLTAANLSNMHLGPQQAQIRPIAPGMIPPPPPPFDTLPPRLQGNQQNQEALSNRIPSLDTLQTDSSKSLNNDGRANKFAMPSNLIGDIKSGKNKTDSYSPPPSPEVDVKTLKPEKVRLSAQMRCKVFIKHGHQAWKSLGSGGLKLYTESPSNFKQLVVESDKAKSLLISNYVLLDAVERVGKTGIAVEMSDNGKRTGIIYLIQLKSENSVRGLFDELVKNSGRDVR